MHHPTVAVGGGFGVGHHRADRDVALAPPPAAGDCCGFRAEALELGGRRRLSPGVGDPAHAGAGEGDAVAVAVVGVGRQIHAVGMQAMDAAITGAIHWYLAP